VAGETVRRFATDPDVMARCVLAAYERFGYDGIEIGVDAVIEAEALGSEVAYPENEPPHVIRPLLGDGKKGLTLLKKPADPKRAGRMPFVIAATKKVRERIGNEAYVQSIVMGPMNIASQLRGVENLILDILEDPDFVRELLSFTLRQSIEYARALLAAGATGLDIGEAFCSLNLISPQIYRTFALELHRALIDDIHDQGGFAELHVCGNTTEIIEDLKSTGADYLDIDWPVDIGRVVSLVPCRGNLDPSRILLLGDRALVLEEASRVIAKAAPSRGLILGSGCEIAPNTPLENIAAMVDAVRQAAA
jgi:uroporphyrinogen decarboxylase